MTNKHSRRTEKHQRGNIDPTGHICSGSTVVKLYVQGRIEVSMLSAFSARSDPPMYALSVVIEYVN